MKLKRFKVNNLWYNMDVDWKLHPRLNILVGPNGSGKSITINLMYELLNWDICYNRCPKDSVEITLSSEEPIVYPSDTYNKTMRDGLPIYVKHIKNPYGGIYISSSDTRKLEKMMKKMGFDIPKFPERHLSTGDNNLFQIIYTVHVCSIHARRRNVNPIVFLDGPEMGLSVDRQERLIGWLLRLCPRGQFIVATHSPFICTSWEKYVIDIEKIISRRGK